MNTLGVGPSTDLCAGREDGDETLGDSVCAQLLGSQRSTLTIEGQEHAGS
jgi:hypothetical protein